MLSREILIKVLVVFLISYIPLSSYAQDTSKVSFFGRPEMRKELDELKRLRDKLISVTEASDPHAKNGELIKKMSDRLSNTIAEYTRVLNRSGESKELSYGYTSKDKKIYNKINKKILKLNKRRHKRKFQAARQVKFYLVTNLHPEAQKIDEPYPYEMTIDIFLKNEVRKSDKRFYKRVRKVNSLLKKLRDRDILSFDVIYIPDDSIPNSYLQVDLEDTPRVLRITKTDSLKKEVIERIKTLEGLLQLISGPDSTTIGMKGPFRKDSSQVNEFATGKFTITDEERSKITSFLDRTYLNSIKAVKKYLRDSGSKLNVSVKANFILNGYSDTQPYKECGEDQACTDRKNQLLSRKRAEAVKAEIERYFNSNIIRKETKRDPDYKVTGKGYILPENYDGIPSREGTNDPNRRVVELKLYYELYFEE